MKANTLPRNQRSQTKARVLDISSLNNMQWWWEAVTVAIVLLAFAAVSGPIEDAKTPEEKGLAIAVAADERDTGWGDWSAEAQMILRNSQGQESSRQMKMKALEQKTDGDKRLIIFDQPRDVKGTAFLVFTKKTGNDDQWLFLPALKRIKRISSKNQSGPFVGSEFAYEDLSSLEVEKYTYKYLKDEVVDGLDAYVVERFPTDKNSGYTRQIAWIDKAEFRLLKVDYYDRKKKLLKTLTASKYKSYGKNYWRAGEFNMQNHQNKKSTVLAWSEYEFTKGLKERDFDQSSLRNAR